MSPDTLEWPPPGLGELHGRIRALTRWAGAASCFILAASMGFAAFVPREFWTYDASSALLFAIWGGVGVLILTGAVAMLWRDVGRASDAVRRGYTWLTIAETMADHRGDTGALISGAREYAGLAPEIRSAIRVARVGSACALLFAAVLPVPALAFAGMYGSFVTNSYTWTLVAVLVPSVVLALVSLAAMRVERFATREARMVIADAFTDRRAATAVVAPWYTAFDDARAGQPLGRGRAGGAIAGWLVGAVSALAVGAVAVSLTTLWIVSMQGPEVFTWQSMRGYTGGIGRDRSYSTLRVYRVHPDSSITPQRAGEALQSLALRGTRPQSPLVRAVTVTLPEFPSVPDSLFRGSRPVRGWPNVYGSAIPAAIKGLSPAQRAFLDRVAGDPGWDLYRIAARAPRIDMVAARIVTPFADTLSPYALSYPTPPLALAMAAYSRAALMVANGKPDDAEMVIGEMFAVGFHMVDDGVSLADEQEGLRVVSLARQGLRELYQAPGMGARKAKYDSVVNLIGVVAAPPGANTAAGRAQYTKINAYSNPNRDAMLNALVDSEVPRSIRFGLVRAASALVCTDVRELLFGPSADLREAIAAARKDLVRSPAEGALFELNTLAATRPFHAKTGDGGFTMGQWVLLRTARIASAVLWNKRIVNCAELAVGARQLSG